MSFRGGAVRGRLRRRCPRAPVAIGQKRTNTDRRPRPLGGGLAKCQTDPSQRERSRLLLSSCSAACSPQTCLAAPYARATQREPRALRRASRSCREVVIDGAKRRVPAPRHPPSAVHDGAQQRVDDGRHRRRRGAAGRPRGRQAAEPARAGARRAPLAGEAAERRRTEAPVVGRHDARQFQLQGHHRGQRTRTRGVGVFRAARFCCRRLAARPRRGDARALRGEPARDARRRRGGTRRGVKRFAARPRRRDRARSFSEPLASAGARGTRHRSGA